MIIYNKFENSELMMTDYKPTLNLPVTDFPMKANLSAREPEILKSWEEKALYQTLRKINKGKPEFILHDGPIYANGQIHIGHALNRILKDIVVKSKSLEGYDAPFVPGWDCHGLPVELNVEKKFGKAGEKLNPKEFRQKCREYAQSQIYAQRDAFKRLGILGDWENPYLTMDFKYEADIMRALGKIIENGHLQQGFKPVHWCIDCRSALAEAEVEYQDKISSAIDVKFRVLNPENFPGEGDLIIPIWTTTPWTLPANEAVALNALHTYVLIQVTTTDSKPERLFIAKELLNSCLERYKILEHKILGEYQENDLKNVKLQHPIYSDSKISNKIVPVIFGDHVTLDTGTGAVHTAPAHGLDDYIIGLEYKLPVNNPVDEKGCFTENTPIFAGEFIFKANQHIIDILREKNNLLAENKLEHSYPHCWRHKSPVIFRATPQWFISMDKNHLRENALEEIQKTNWIPDWGLSRIYGMVEGRPDWCISRQRQWCTPMGLIIHKETKTLHPDMFVLMEQIAERIEKQGIEAWYELDLRDILGDQAEQYEKSEHTLDVWFDSGVSHFAVLRGKIADIYLEGSDQHRGWFHSALLTSVAMTEKAPYKTVLTHGFTVDEKGRKMSKSLGNVIMPEKIINSLGADILRLWVAATDYKAEIVFSDEILQRTSEAYRRIRNTMRFLLANLHDFDVTQNLILPSELLSLDKWIIKKAEDLQIEIREAYSYYQFHVIYQKLQHFCIVELGGFYLDVIKDRQYTMQKNSLGRRSAQTAIYHILQAMTRWIAPILSFTAEEIWQYLPQEKQEESVFLAEYYVFPKINYSDDIDWQKIMLLRESVNKELETKRNLKEIGSGLEADVHITAPDDMYTELLKLKDELRFVWITSQASIEKGDEINIQVSPIEFQKCARCWHRREDVGANTEHPDICLRCVDNLPDGKGEERRYA